MPILTQKPVVEIRATIEFKEEELRALYALTDCGADDFLAMFYKYMGTSGLEPHEPALRAIFAEIRRVVPDMLDRADLARATFEGRTRVA